MTKTGFSAVLAMTTFVLLGCAGTQESAQKRELTPVAQAQLEALYSRTRTADWTSANGGSGTATYTRDGVAQLDWDGGSADGNWRIANDEFCTKYENIENGTERCFSFFEAGENTFEFHRNGTYAGSLSYTN